MDTESATPFDVRLVPQHPWHSIVIRGELDLSSAHLLTTSCATVPDGVVMLDLSGLTFIDCAGYRALADVIASIDADGRRSLLVGFRGQVARFLALVGHDCAPANLYVAVSSALPPERPHGPRGRLRRPARSCAVDERGP